MAKRPPSPKAASRDSHRIALAAAQWMTQSGSRDIAHARQRAARQLGVHDPSRWPSERQIEQALAQHQRLFARPVDLDELARKRHAALEAMRFFGAFQPRLVGDVLSGELHANSVVELHLHHDEPEAVQRFLEDHQLPATLRTGHIRLDHGRPTAVLSWHLQADGTPFALYVLPESALRQPPLREVDDTPLPRASRAQLQTLLA